MMTTATDKITCILPLIAEAVLTVTTVLLIDMAIMVILISTGTGITATMVIFVSIHLISCN